MSKQNNKKSSPDPMDEHVGKRLRARRSLIGMSQEKLAEAVGLTFQQIQKYERATNRISASRLYQMANILNVPVTYFYDNFISTGDTSDTGTYDYGMSDAPQESFQNEDLLYSKETLELLRIYYGVEDEQARKDLLKVIKTMADNLSK